MDVYSSDPAVQMTLGVEATPSENSSNTLIDTIELGASRTEATQSPIVYFTIVVYGANKLKRIKVSGSSDLQVLATPHEPRGLNQPDTKNQPQIVVGSLRMLSHLHEGDIGYEIATFSQTDGYSDSGPSLQAQLTNDQWLLRIWSIPRRIRSHLLKGCTACTTSRSLRPCFSSPDQIYSAAQLRKSVINYKVLDAFPSDYVAGANVNWSNVFGLRPLQSLRIPTSQRVPVQIQRCGQAFFSVIAGAGILALVQEFKGENWDGLRKVKFPSVRSWVRLGERSKTTFAMKRPRVYPFTSTRSLMMSASAYSYFATWKLPRRRAHWTANRAERRRAVRRPILHGRLRCSRKSRGAPRSWRSQ